MRKTFFILALFILCVSCGKEKKEQPTDSGLFPSKFVTNLESGKTTRLYTLKNANGMEVCVTNIGARIVSIWVPDRTGAFRDVVLGFDNIESYIPVNTNYGAIIGRYANRIAGGKLTLSNGATYTLRQNNGNNSIHGGPRGFHTCFFDIHQPDNRTLICQYLSKNMEEGFPGEFLITVIYTLTEDNALGIDYEAKTGVLTAVNLTNHSYFNLSGNPGNTILDHLLYLNADSYTPTDAEMIPTGKIDKIANTPLDFTNLTAIGDRINDTTFEAIRFGNGYDQNFVLNSRDINVLAAKLVSPASGIAMEVYTTEPGIQVYTGNHMSGSDTGKNGIAYQRRSAVCLETQHFPDSPNHPNFPSTELRPGALFKSNTIYKFGVYNPN
jgi:aldose 1-epimerase